ncbi:MAG: hypothetical protein NTV33_13615, partial [Coprothermobacterota bacterium]|nr:hypothetical protein [Coprothermobacterota bacterium]
MPTGANAGSVQQRALDTFKWARFRLVYRAVQPLLLPPYKGSTFRGPFGGIFHDLVCTRSGYSHCNLCPLHTVCPYAIVFEPSPPEDARMMQRFSDIPRPFVIEPELSQKTTYQPGETFTFDFLVFGKAIQLFPYFVLTFRDFGEKGIGKGRGRVVLERVDFLGREGKSVVYQEGDNLVHTKWKAETGEDLLHGEAASALSIHIQKSSELILEFQTITRLTKESQVVSKPEFPVLIRNLARRFSALLAFYHDTPLEIDYPALFAQAEAVHLVKNETHWQEWERYSRRQQKKMEMGGLVG